MLRKIFFFSLMLFVSFGSSSLLGALQIYGCASGNDISMVSNKEAFQQRDLFVELVRRNRFDIAEKIISKINNQNFDGCTALHNACITGNLGQIAFLVRHKAQVNIYNRYNGFTPLHFAALSEDTKIVEILLAQGADIDSQDFCGLTPLHWAATVNILDEPCEKDQMVRFLCERGADITKVGRDGLTPFFLACKKGFIEAVDFLLKQEEEAGRKVNTKNEQGLTPLYVAMHCADDDLSRISFLLKKGALINEVDGDGNTPLHRLFLSWDGEGFLLCYLIKKAQFLIRHGANESALNKKSETPICIFMDRVEGVELAIDELLEAKFFLNWLDEIGQ